MAIQSVDTCILASHKVMFFFLTVYDVFKLKTLNVDNLVFDAWNFVICFELDVSNCEYSQICTYCLFRD